MSKFVCLSSSDSIFERLIRLRDKVVIHPNGHITYLDLTDEEAEQLTYSCINVI
jgi:hypothetical protein